MVDVSQQRASLITISYAPSGQESRLHRIFIPWTDDYNVALESAKTKMKRFFPEGTDNEFRWLASKAVGGSGWTELDADVFPAIAKELEDRAELRLEESCKLKSGCLTVFHQSDGVLLVYNLTKEETFKECEDWRKDLEKNIDNFSEVQVVLVGNQVDNEKEREVSTDEAQAYADRHGFKFAEVSAKDGTNVEQMFQTLMDDVVEKLSAQNALVQYRRSKDQQRRKDELAPPKTGGCKC
ncbi:hypothetical protein RSAG8_07610, partial [Rhizoctonia solani AG-8 WAC10335]